MYDASTIKLIYFDGWEVT